MEMRTANGGVSFSIKQF